MNQNPENPLNVSSRAINYLLRIHTMPEELESPDPENPQALAAHDLYLFAINSALLWRVSQIDEPGNVHWIEINFENEDGRDEFHILAVEDEICRQVECEDYAVPVYEFE